MAMRDTEKESEREMQRKLSEQFQYIGSDIHLRHMHHSLYLRMNRER